MYLTKGALAPLLLFSFGFIFVLLISVFPEWILWWGGAACLGLLFLRKADNRFPLSPISIAFIIYTVILFLNGVVFNNIYHGEAAFHILFFILPFSVFSRLDTSAIERFFKAAAFVFVLLVVWGLIQHVTGSFYIVDQGRRASAIFYVSNTFATGINLFLLPFIALYLLGVNTRLTYWLSMFFFSGLMATQSRGGYLGLTSGMLFLALFNIAGQRQLKFSPNRWVRLAAGFAVVILIFQFSPGWSGEDVKATIVEGHTSDRLVLYGIAWEAIKANPIWGYGYYNFGYIFDRYKVTPFNDKIAIFVHNDYLQAWLETGLPGLLALLLVIGVFYLNLWKKRKYINPMQNHVWLFIIGAALTSFLVHAAVDFPFYVPAMQFLFSAYLGTLNVFFRDASVPEMKFVSSVNSLLNRIGIRPVVAKGTAAFLFLFWLLQPAIAQFAADKAKAGLKKGDVRYALDKFTLARRLVPGNTHYYWCEGTILMDQGVELQNRELAIFADKAFAKGLSVNPYYSNNLMSRIRLHRDYRTLLDNPVSNETLLQWAEHMRTWNPHFFPVKFEYVRTLAFAGKKQEAMKFAKNMQIDYPKSKLIKDLINDLEHGAY